MSTSQWLLVVNISAVVIAAAAIVAALHSVNRQLRMTTFIEYTKRYSKIMDKLPFEARRPGGVFRLDAQSPEQREAVLKAYRSYLNLCWEEKWLDGSKHIDPATWDVWKDAMQQSMDFPDFDEVWRILKPEYEPYGDFAEFFESLLAKARAGRSPDDHKEID